MVRVLGSRRCIEKGSGHAQETVDAVRAAGDRSGLRSRQLPHPVRMIVPWAPGQATDLVGRVIAARLSELFGQQVVADNRAGAGGTIGTGQAAKAPPDGYTILAASSGPVTIAPLLQKVPYVAEKDLAPVALTGRSPYILVSAPSFPARPAREFVTLLKSNPGKYTFASSGAGATAHLIAVRQTHSAATWPSRRRGSPTSSSAAISSSNRLERAVPSPFPAALPAKDSCQARRRVQPIPPRCRSITAA